MVKSRLFLKFAIVALILLCLPSECISHWWFMSELYALGSKIMCSSVAGLVNVQRTLCRQNPDVMISIGKGAKLGVEECQYQFRFQRWNCSTVKRDASVFGKVMLKASRETAFVYAISAAGVVHEVTKSCSLGELKECTCENRRGRSKKGFEWGGCSDNINYGLNFAKTFVDAREEERDARALMNLHNNQVGRRAVKFHSVLDCKCHGVSGSCSVKTCWKTMGPFRRVGDYLRQKYKNASPVSVSQSGKDLMSAEESYGKPSRDALVFLEESPDYCDPDPKTGSLGTSERVCNRTLDGPGGCGVLCCGRGFNTFQVEKEYKCHCKFHWCCHVQCQTCRRTVDRHVCKGNKDVRLPTYNRSGTVNAAKKKKKKKKNRKKNKLQRKLRKNKRIQRKKKQRGGS